MQDAVVPFREALAEIDFAEPSVPVVSCATGLAFVDPREELAAALVRPVRWRETMIALTAGGVQSFVDAGAGRELATLAPRCVPGAGAASLDMLLGNLEESRAA
jgi:malonyl CoA-acyl carrier protein transacylase